MSNHQQPHRKQVKHYHQPGDLHELTFSCYRQLKLLTNDDWRQRLSSAMDDACRKVHVELVAFVYMPEHVHLLVNLVCAPLLCLKPTLFARWKPNSTSIATRRTALARPVPHSRQHWLSQIHHGPYNTSNCGLPVIIQRTRK